LIEIRWDGRRHQRRSGGPIVADDVQRSLRRSLFVVERSKDAKSDLDQALTSSNCPSCGAPDDGGTGSGCSFCGFVLNDGSKDWVLTGIHPWTSSEVRGLLQELREGPREPAPSRAETLRWALATALEDHHIDPTEGEVLRSMAQKLGVPGSHASQLLEQAQHASAEAPTPRNPGEARRWLEVMVAAMLDDGSISADENKMLKSAAARFGLGGRDLAKLVGDVRRGLYQETKLARRARS
jgi:tellurite resistance protein